MTKQTFSEYASKVDIFGGDEGQHTHGGRYAVYQLGETVFIGDDLFCVIAVDLVSRPKNVYTLENVLDDETRNVTEDTLDYYMSADLTHPSNSNRN